MKKTKVQNKLLILLQIIVFCVFSISLSMFFSLEKNASAVDVSSQESLLVGEGLVGNANGLTFTFTENSSGEATNVNPDTPLDVIYKGEAYDLLANVGTDSAAITGEITYQWYYSLTGDTYEILEGETSLSVEIRDAGDSGFYVLQVLDNGVSFGDSGAIEVNLAPKEITLTNFSVPDKIYDGTTSVNFTFTQSEELFENDASIIVSGQVEDGNAGSGKLVSNITASISDASLEGNYKLVYDEPNSLSANILPKPVVLNQNSITETRYDGTDHRSKINPFYTDIYGARKYLNFTITSGATTVDDIVNAGSYTITPLKLASDSNYEFYTDSSFETLAESYRFRVLKATPQITLEKSDFVYTGSEQDVSDFISINNNEQVLQFLSNTTFTTYSEGTNIGTIRVVAPESTNYIRLEESFTINVEKATPEFDFSNVKTEYEYNGMVQSFDTSSVLINNDEQTLIAGVSDFQNVGDYEVSLHVEESENYKARILDNLAVKIVKRKIDVSNLTWGNTTSFLFEKGRVREVSISNVPSQVIAEYENNSKVDSGIYEASVTFTLRDEHNYELVGSVSNLTWEIRKRSITIPRITSDSVFTYDGAQKSVSINQNLDYYVMTGNTATNAGNYTIKINLVDANNTVWSNGTNGAVEYAWTINKQIVNVPTFSNQVGYTGNEVSLGIEQSDLYQVLGATGTSLGKYTAFLLLNDFENYAWEGKESPLIRIDWEIVGEIVEDKTTPITAIIVGIVIIVALGIFVTLQFTVVKKKKLSKETVGGDLTNNANSEVMTNNKNKNSVKLNKNEENGVMLNSSEQTSLQIKTELQVEKAKTTIRKRKNNTTANNVTTNEKGSSRKSTLTSKAKTMGEKTAGKTTTSKTKKLSSSTSKTKK